MSETEKEIMNQANGIANRDITLATDGEALEEGVAESDDVKNEKGEINMARNRKSRYAGDEFEPAGEVIGKDVHNNKGISGPHGVGTMFGSAGTNASDFENVLTDGKNNALDAEFAKDAGTDGTACDTNVTQQNGNGSTRV
jgi:hypothetical protein